MLEKLIAYEAVHEIQSWDDLKNRLGADRRCYAFFHLRMPDEPLIFVEVALVSHMSNSIQEPLDETTAPRDPWTAKTAVFYSISNTQTGLQGVNFGSFLIQRVADRLAAELAGVKTFATLSPIPGFQHYVETQMNKRQNGLLTESEREVLDLLLGVDTGGHALDDLLFNPGWYQDRQTARSLKGPLMRLCAHYLIREKRDGRALDAVANFHLSNGALVERINWLGDVSPKGMHQSLGLMVNYRYNLVDIEANHETYRATGEVTVSPAVRRLLGTGAGE